MAQEYNQDDVEYKFKDTEDKPQETTNDQQSEDTFQTTQKQSKMKRTIASILMVLIVVFVGYRTIVFLFGGHKKAKPVAVVQPVTPPQKIITPTVGETEISADVNQLKTNLAQLSKKSEDLLSNFSAQSSKSDAQISDINQQLTQIGNNLSDLQDTVANVSNRLHTIEQAKQNEAKRKAKAYAEQQKRIRLDKKYYVEAVIPGRAWLRAVDGTAITCSVGDIVSGYGKIQSIDAYSGRVVTTLGGTLTYGVSGN